jgi:8-oxo-dGTP diphosphatase
VSVGAADVLRCEATVAPLAESTGLAVESWPAWSERGDGSQPAAALAALGELVAAGRPVAVCSQGGVIPGVLEAVGGRALRGLTASKGSVWVLSYAAGELVAADYLRSLLPVA